jgi:hypothetical protein
LPIEKLINTHPPAIFKGLGREFLGGFVGGLFEFGFYVLAFRFRCVFSVFFFLFCLYLSVSDLGNFIRFYWRFWVLF